MRPAEIPTGRNIENARTGGMRRICRFIGKRDYALMAMYSPRRNLRARRFRSARLMVE